MSPGRKKTPDNEYPEFPGSLPRPKVARAGDCWTCRWPQDCGPESCAVMQFDSPRESSDGFHTEMTVWFLQNPSELIVPSATPYFTKGLRFNLSSAQARESAVKRLRSRKEAAIWRDGNTYALRWPDMVEQAFPAVIDSFREGSATLNATKDVKEEAEVLYAIERLLPLNQTAAIYCDGGLGKSWLALLIAILIALGIDHQPFKIGRTIPARGVPSLYLDWEVEEVEFRRRIGWIVRGLCIAHGWESPWTEERLLASLDARLWYRRMSRAIHQDVSRVKHDIDKLGIGFVAIDSIVPASGGNPNDAEVASAAMNAIRDLYPATRLILAHISKGAANDTKDNGKDAGIFGSAFYRNLARSLWEFKADSDRGQYQVGLVNRKQNVGMLQEPFGLSYRFDEDAKALIFAPISVKGNSELVKALGPETAILAALKKGRLSLEDLKDASGLSEPTIRKYGAKLSQRDLVLVTPGGGAKNKTYYERTDLPTSEGEPQPEQVTFDDEEG